MRKTIGQRIRLRREDLNMTQDDLAKKLGYKSRSSINKIELDKCNLRQSKIKAIADALLTTPSYIMGWEESPTPPAANLRTGMEYKKLPRVGAIACGQPITVEENIEGYDSVPAYVHADFTLLCKGDSMINARIFDGDIVCIRQQEDVESGEIAAVLIGDEATLKRVRKYEDHIALEPENPLYRPLVFWGEEMNDVRILGKATHFISKVR